MQGTLSRRRTLGVLIMAAIDLDNYRFTLQDKLAELTSGNRDRESLAAESAPDEMDQTRGRQERDMAVEVCNRDAETSWVTLQLRAQTYLHWQIRNLHRL